MSDARLKRDDIDLDEIDYEMVSDPEELDESTLGVFTNESRNRMYTGNGEVNLRYKAFYKHTDTDFSYGKLSRGQMLSKYHYHEQDGSPRSRAARRRDPEGAKKGDEKRAASKSGRAVKGSHNMSKSEKRHAMCEKIALEIAEEAVMDSIFGNPIPAIVKEKVRMHQVLQDHSASMEAT